MGLVPTTLALFLKDNQSQQQPIPPQETLEQRN